MGRNEPALFPSVFLKKLSDSVVVFCDPHHYGLWLGVLHVIGDSAYFLGSKAQNSGLSVWAGI
jgi:hypothetical protein